LNAVRLFDYSELDLLECIILGYSNYFSPS
jgi:hypothetical protein